MNDQREIKKVNEMALVDVKISSQHAVESEHNISHVTYVKPSEKQINMFKQYEDAIIDYD